MTCSTVPESLVTRDDPPTHEINTTLNQTDASKQTDEQAFLNTERHFTGVSRLYGSAALARFATSHIGVIGIGGVGSWAAEALARSGIAKLTLIDLDHIAISNMNRQLHTLNSTLGMAKVIAMKQRIADIHPAIVVRVIEDFVTPENVNALLEKTLDGVLDCTDDVKAKVAIAHWARTHGVPLLMSGSAGGRLDATRLKSADLSVVSHDKLLAKVRQKLRADYGFPQTHRSKPQPIFGLPCIYSDENIIYPETSCAPGGLSGLNCAGYGASVCVTASFGFALAGALLKHLASR
ncbi:MAG: tRNA threonylcarbamoyladenosine dehydratase [Methylophilaceae bacterium]|nr:tRNA threonylcarbamoyladenosine dehydratase [Methylophilaceae bacterium]